MLIAVLQYCSIAVIAECVYNTVFQHLNYVFITFAIFSQCYTYILSYIRVVIISLQLNINTLDIKILYNLRGFTVQVTYICQNYLRFHTVSFENYNGGF